MKACQSACRHFGWILVGPCLLILLVSAHAGTSVVLYATYPDHRSDARITGTIGGRTAAFEYQHTHNPAYPDRELKSSYVRFAADGPVDIRLAVRSTITSANLRTIGKDLPFTLHRSTFTFTLPGPGTYYLQLPDLGTAGSATYTVFFFFDGLSAYRDYQAAFARARNVLSSGVISDPHLDQTKAVQSVLDGGGTIYFPAGIYRTGMLSIGSNTTVYLGPGSVLKAADSYDASRYIYISGKRNVRIAGPGTVDANGFSSGNRRVSQHLMDMEAVVGLRLDDVLFRNSNSWQLHIRKCDQVRFRNVKVFSGKDGIDPDGSRDVVIERTAIQSVDDGFAVKSRFPRRSCERVSMRDSVVFSCASSLKIGSENYFGAIRDITWDNCDAVDADRGCVLYTKVRAGVAPISDITWRNVRVFNYPWSTETGGAPFHLRNDAAARLSNVTFENVVAWPTQACSTRGQVTATFRNVVMNGPSSIDPGTMPFEGVIWPGVASQSRPVVFVSASRRSHKEYRNGDEIRVSVQHPFQRPISRVELFVDGVSAGVRTSQPYAFAPGRLTLGEHTVRATAIDADGVSNTTAPLRIMVVR